MRGERDLVAGARVVEARGDVDDEAHLPAHGEDPADHAVAVRRLAGARRGHEVLHLPHSVGHQEARDEDVGVGEVELLGAPAVAVGRDAEQAPAVGVEDRREDARRVEARAAVPVDRPVGADERDGVQVADQAVLGDGQVARPRCATELHRTRPVATGQHGRRAPSASVLVGLRHEHELALRRRALEQLVRVARLGSGRRSATTGWILPSRSSSISTREVLPELLRVHRLPADCSVSPRRTGRGTSGRGRRTPAGGATACPRARRSRSPRTT